MNLVDSCGWIEYATDGPNAGFFAPAIEQTRTLVVPTVCLFEVFKKVFREMSSHQAINIAAQMQRGTVIELDAATALAAAGLSSELKLPLADSVILATARAQNAVIWTQDAHFSDFEGVKYIKWKD
jgi:toxin FitB